MDLLECLFCGRHFPHDPFSPFCPDCREPLLAAPIGPAGKKIHADEEHPFRKFADFLPLAPFEPSLSLGEGKTPLIALDKLGAELGMSSVFAKNEAQNPTGSFKDRGTALAVQKAVSLGFKRIGTVSTGNMAASTAAYGARAQMQTYVLLKEGTSRTSVQAAGIFGPVLVTVRGDYGRLFYKSLEVGRKLGIYFMNSVDPFRIEGYKVTGLEVFLELGRRVPGSILVPLSSGGHLLGLMRAFEDLERAGLSAEYPTFIGIQAEGCAPLVKAWEAGRLRYERLEKADTFAHAISNPAPPAGNAVLRLIREHKGILVSVSDQEMIEAQRGLASSEGIFCQPESAVTLAGLIKLREKSLLPAGGPTVLVLTGGGFKAPQALETLPLAVRDADLEELEKGLL
jgi:threonine synthase